MSHARSTPSPVQLTFDRLALGFIGPGATPEAPPRCCRARLPVQPLREEWPLDDESTSPSTFTAEFHHRCVTVELRQCTWPHQVRLQLRTDHEGRTSTQFDLVVRVRPRLALKVRTAGKWESRTWGLTAGLTRTSGDPFVEARNWIYRALTPPRPRRGRAADRGLSNTMRDARATLHDAACAMVDLLDSATRKVALRFPNHMRPWLYRQLVADPTGRLAQVAHACPGALTFAYALQAFGRRTGCVPAAGRLLQGIIQGRPLNLLLEEAVSAWAASAGKILVRDGSPEGYQRTWRCLLESQGDARQSLLQAQRLLIRRAGAGVPSLTLWLPPPPAFAPEDIPMNKLANARWFRVVKCLRPILAFRDEVRPEHGHGLCVFVSQHALEVHERGELGHSDYWRVGTLLDYARANNHWPQRSTSAARYLEAVEAWHRQFQGIQLMAELAGEAGAQLTDSDGNPLPFPKPPCPGWRSGENTITPLRTAEEVLAEGNRMHNCVACRVGEALTGQAFLYHGEIAGRSLTIQIEREDIGYRLVQAAGVSNAAPTAAQKRGVSAFIAHLQLGEGCRCEA